MIPYVAEALIGLAVAAVMIYAAMEPALPGMDFIRMPPIYPPGSWGGGPGPTGTRNDPTLQPGLGAALTPRFKTYSVNQDHPFILASANVAQRAQPIFVPPDTLVAIRAHNGSSAGNNGNIKIARQPELLSTATVLTPDTQISWPVDQLDQVWFIGANAGDGIIISLQRGRSQ